MRRMIAFLPAVLLLGLAAALPVSRYLLEGTTPAEGTTCAADFGPFDTP